MPPAPSRCSPLGSFVRMPRLLSESLYNITYEDLGRVFLFRSNPGEFGNPGGGGRRQELHLLKLISPVN